MTQNATPVVKRRWLGRAARPLDEAMLRWRAARRWTAAFVVAAFPLLFILDEATAFGTSPVLPGLGLLAVLIVLLPFLLAESLLRVGRNLPAEGRLRRAARGDQWAGLARTLAVGWFVGWLALGA